LQSAASKNGIYWAISYWGLVWQVRGSGDSTILFSSSEGMALNERHSNIEINGEPLPGSPQR
jgi:hypothetical protein